MYDTDMVEEIKELRKKLELTQEAFAIKLGISVMTVRRWESGRTKPSRMAKQLLREIQEVRFNALFASEEHHQTPSVKPLNRYTALFCGDMGKTIIKRLKGFLQGIGDFFRIWLC